MKNSIIISGIIWLCILLMVWVYFILSNSTVEIKTTKVNIDGTPIKKEKIKTEKEVKKETKKDDDTNTQYVIHTTEANVITGEVGYWIFTPDWEKIKELKEIYSLYTEQQLSEKYKSPNYIVFSDGIYNYFYDKSMSYQWKYYKIDDKENFLKYIINNGNLYLSTYKYWSSGTNKIVNFPVYRDTPYILDEWNEEISWFTSLGHLIITKKTVTRNPNGSDNTTYTKMLYSDSLKPILKNGFEDIYEYKTHYEWFDLNFYVIKTTNNKYYLYYFDKWNLVSLPWTEDGFDYQINMWIKNNKLFIFNRDWYISYNLDVNEYQTDGRVDLWGWMFVEWWIKETKKDLKIGKKEIGKLSFDLESLKEKGVNYNYIRLDWIWEYNWNPTYKINFWIYKYEWICIWWNCKPKYINEFKIYNTNWNEITDKKANIYISKDFEQKWKYDFENNYAKLTKWENVANWIKWLKNIRLFNNDITTKINYNYWDYYSTFKEYTFSIEQTPTWVYFKNSISWEKVSDNFNEILWYNENANLFALINDKNENCLYKIIQSKVEKQYCTGKQILWYKDGYILEWVWYSWDFWKIIEKDWVKIFEKLNLKNKDWKDIIVSEFNVFNDYILIVDTENNFYLFEKDKLIYSWKREWRGDFEIFLVDKNIIKNSILKD